jgi:Beta protein
VVHYRPVLRAGLGEFEALARAGDAAWRVMTPVLELAPWQRDARSACKHFLDRVLEHLPVRVFAVDAGEVPPDTSLRHGGGVLGEVLTELAAANVPVIPVVRAGVLEDWADAGRYARPYGMVLRLRPAELDADAEILVPPLLAALGRIDVRAENTDLMLDFAALEGLARPGVARQVARLRAAAPWRSVTIASGAFPGDLRGVAQGEVVSIRRRDVDLWRALRAGFAYGGELDYADYGVFHPHGTPNRNGWRAARENQSQLRYTVQDRWLVLKGAPKRDFPDLCRRVRALPEFTPDLGAADQAIVAYASGWHGTGDSTTWRGISTAHHLDFVTDRLRNWGEP